tara:strand:- start:26574 stop:27944 length:1371 start_codon:yes stop_codon:yes gene_type:complete
MVGFNMNMGNAGLQVGLEGVSGRMPTGRAPTGGVPNISSISPEQRTRIMEMLAKIRGIQMAEGGAAGFPDLNKDGKISYADVLRGRGVEMAGGGIADIPLHYRRGGILGMLGRIAGTVLLTPFLGPVGASAASSAAVGVLEGKEPDEILGDAAMSALFSYGAGKIFGGADGIASDIVGDTTLGETVGEFGGEEAASSLTGTNITKAGEGFFTSPEYAGISDLPPVQGDVGADTASIVEPTYLQKLGATPMSNIAMQAAGEGIKYALTPPEPEPFSMEEEDPYTISPAAPMQRRLAPIGSRTFFNPYSLQPQPVMAEGGPAKLNENDFVITADVVSDIGDGDTTAGAKRLANELGMSAGGANYQKGNVINSGLQGLVGGPGSGLDDKVQATIGGRQAARLSRGEFVIPRNKVAEIGGGNITKGHEKLYNLMKNVREDKNGTPQQPGPLSRTLSSMMG